MTDLYARFIERDSGKADPRSGVAKDRDRIVHSGALRRLQRKSQIVGAQTSDFFRTRLTHTLECAQIGRAIARRVEKSDWAEVVIEFPHLEDLVEAACLAHDLGHPPFGHNGEKALQSEMRVHANSLFEGNAQSFRIVTHLEPKIFGETANGTDRWVGLNLSRTTLCAICKYPRVETPEMLDLKGKDRKFCIYCDPSDQEYFAWLWEGKPEEARRTLATEILDVADDIAYAVHDFEDGVWAGMIPLYELMASEESALTLLGKKLLGGDEPRFTKQEEVEEAVIRLLSPLRAEAEDLKGLTTARHWAERPFDRSRDSRANLKNYCSHLIGRFIDDVTADGRYSEPSDDVRKELDVLTAIAWVWMIERSDLATRRFAQRRLVHDLFDGYWSNPEMLPHQDEWRAIHDEARKNDSQWPAKARIICDHIAAMTDLYAYNVHKEMYKAGQSLTLAM